MPDENKDLTNGELWNIIIDKDSEGWQRAVAEMDERLENGNVKKDTGFETPPKVPPTP